MKEDKRDNEWKRERGGECWVYSECEKIERQKRNEKVIKASTKVVRLVFMMGFSRATRTAVEEEAEAKVEGEEAAEQAAEGERQHRQHTHSNKTLVNEEAKGPRCLSIKMPLSCDTDTHTHIHSHTHTYAHTHTHLHLHLHPHRVKTFTPDLLRN